MVLEIILLFVSNLARLLYPAGRIAQTEMRGQAASLVADIFRFDGATLKRRTAMKGFRPLEDRVLVRRIAAQEKKRQGGSSFLIPQRKSRSKARSPRSAWRAR
jgi:hypothetical protein